MDTHILQATAAHRLPRDAASSVRAEPAEPLALTPTRRLRTWKAPRALQLNGLVLASFLAASSAPSPIYPVYSGLWGTSALMLTVVFASYAIAMLIALLVLGRLSDHRGRREVIVVALLLEIASLVLFWYADAAGWLIAARIVQGVATGMASSAAGAALVDLHRERGALVNSLAPMVGLGIGALGTSVLVQSAPAPTRLVFEVLLVLFVLLLVAAVFLPETAQRSPGALRSLRPAIALPAAARATMLKVLPVATALWAVAGFYFSLGPSLARHLTGGQAPLAGGVLIASLTFASAAAMAVTRRLVPATAIAAGTLAFSTGVLVALGGMLAGSTLAALLGTVVSGAGFGAAFSGSVRALVPLAQPHERAALMSAFLAACYLAFSLPAMGAGLLAGAVGLQWTAAGYGVAMAFLALATLVPRKARQAG